MERTAQVLLDRGLPKSKKNSFGKVGRNIIVLRHLLVFRHSLQVPRDIAHTYSTQIMPEATVSALSSGILLTGE